MSDIAQEKEDRRRRLAKALLDWRTGQYTQRDLAQKWGISQPTLQRATKRTSQDLAPEVHRQADKKINKIIDSEPDSETVQAVVNHESDFLARNKRMVNSATMLNLKVLMQALKEEHDRPKKTWAPKMHLDAQLTIDKAAVTMGIFPRFAPTAAELLLKDEPATDEPQWEPCAAAVEAINDRV